MRHPLFRIGPAMRACAAALALAGFSAAAQAPGDVRIALVIGNASYPGNAALSNPLNDAQAMGGALRKLGFTVVEVRDGSRAQMTDALVLVSAALRGKQGVGMLYYAGHGLQLDWHNYMVPVDARMQSAADVPAQSMDINAVIAGFKAAGNRMNIVVLDACRDNPFQGTGGAKGLAQLDAPPGTFLAYATAPGNVADDGDGANGLYTGFLVAELAKPTARIEDVFKRVRLQVRQKSAGRQIPWESTSLEDDFYFDGGPRRTLLAAQEVEQERRRAAQAAGAAAAAREAPRPSPEPAREAAFAAEKPDWDRIKASNKPEDVYSFLNKHPNGLISEAAAEKLERLEPPQIVASPVKGRDAAPQVQRKAKVGDEIEYVYRDVLTKIEQRREVLRVTAVTDELIEYNDGATVLTLGGGTVRNEIGIRFDPPFQSLPVGAVQIGKKWSTRSQQQAPQFNLRGAWADGELYVAAYEEVTVPAGSFKAYRIESTLRSESGLYAQVTTWVTADGYAVKYLRRGRREGRDNSWIREMARLTLR